MHEVLARAADDVEKVNANLEPELLTIAQARKLMAAYARVQKVAGFGLATLASRIEDAAEVARVTGSSVGKAKTVVATGHVMATSDDLSMALQQGAISLDQAGEIAAAEESAPGAAAGLLEVAQEQPMHVLKDKARNVKLEAEQHRDLGVRQHAARRARSYGDALGMVHIHMELEPHVGSPIVARAEAEAQRLARSAKRTGKEEAFERHLADAYAGMLNGAGKGRATRPELVVLVSHEVAKRGWADVRKAEVCKIPGIGPVAPGIAKRIASDAFLNGVFYDGTDLRQFKRWSRNIPVEVQVALELGEPPGFEGVRCVDCGNHFRTEFDHVQPRSNRGPTSKPNLEPRCRPCHRNKTERDRKAARAARSAEP